MKQRLKTIWERKRKSRRNTCKGAEQQVYVTEKREELNATIGKHFKENENGFDENIKGRRLGQLLEDMEQSL